MLCELVRESAAWVSEEGAKGVVRIREDKLRVGGGLGVGCMN